MSIRKSASADVESLIAGLCAEPGDGARREAALARLAVIGQRAIGRLLAALKTATRPEERAALFLALERIPDARSTAAVLAALEAGSTEPPAVRAAAVRAARPLLALTPHGTEVLERLTMLTLDAGEPLPLRRAAFAALGDLTPRTLEPIRRRLLEDPDPAVRALTDRDVPPAVEQYAEPTTLPDRPGAALDLIAAAAADAPLPELHALLAPVRARESEGGRRRAEWTAVRGAIHLALARRGSRVGLYDLREAFETEALHPLPTDFLVAARLIGDAACLESLARAWTHASSMSGRQPERWQQELRDAFTEVLGRQKAASRRKITQRLEARWGEAVKDLWRSRT
ncbi:MAG TPA: hypothetical protein VNK41_11060 [Vicinamibacterales bacterium]|nr:hypothetical protein [Vicinamibacterales bacterium]